MNPNFATAYNRAPDWKFKRAQTIVNGTGIDTTPYWDTENGSYWIRRAVDYLNSYNREPDPIRNNDLIVLYADIYTAHSMYLDRDSYFRCELEAMILARAEREELAIRIDVPVSCIIAYEELFFDVRSKLNGADSYIMNYVIGPELQNIRDNSYGVIWKLFGYKRGPEVLKAVISRTVDPKFAATADAVGSNLNEDIVGSFKVAAAIEAKKSGSGNRGSREMLATFVKMLEVDKQEDLSSGSSKGQIGDHINALLKTLGLTVGQDVGVTGKTNTSGEPQFTELVDLMVRGKSDSFEAEKDFQFPVPQVRGTNTEGK